MAHLPESRALRRTGSGRPRRRHAFLSAYNPGLVEEDHDLLLQTTIAGSLPKPAWLAEPEKLWAPWLLDGEALAEGKRDAVRLVLRDQETAGIDIVTDGEQTRRHFVTTFIEHLDGVDFEHSARPCASATATTPMCPWWSARWRARAPVFVEDARFLRAQTDQRSNTPCPAR